MENKKNEYATKDFYSACLLRASGFSFERLERGEERFCLFVFSDPNEKADELLGRYWKRELSIEAKDLIDSIHDLKSILYSK